MGNCIYCHSTNIQTDVTIGLNAEAGAWGLQYHTRFIVDGVEPLYAELCQDCGSITRFYLKKTDRNWRIKK